MAVNFRAARKKTESLAAYEVYSRVYRAAHEVWFAFRERNIACVQSIACHTRVFAESLHKN